MAMTLNGTTGVTFPSGAVGNSALTRGTAVASTSGTSIDFTNIPSWVNRITLSLNAVSTNSNSNYVVQLGTPTIVTSGYTGTLTTLITNVILNTSLTNGWNFTNPVGASSVFYGQCVLTYVSANSWVYSSSTADQSGRVTMCQGGLTLGSALTVVRLTTNNGTDTFDAGTVNILYE